MFYLDDEGMNRWASVVTEGVEDIKECLDDRGTIGDGVLAGVITGLVLENRPDKVASILPDHVSELSAWGRARRLRLMAWVVNSSLKSGDNFMRAMAELVGEDDEGNGGSTGEASALMHGDFVAFMTALGQRRLTAVLNADSVDDALSTAVELRAEMGMGMGGMP